MKKERKSVKTWLHLITNGIQALSGKQRPATEGENREKIDGKKESCGH